MQLNSLQDRGIADEDGTEMRSGADEVVSSGLSGRRRYGMEGHGELAAGERTEEDGDGVVDGRHGMGP